MLQPFIDFKKAYGSVSRKVLYNILIEFGIPMKLVRLINMCLSETYGRVRVGKNLPDMFPIRNGLKQGDVLFPLLSSFTLKCVIRKVQVIQDDLKLNGTHQLLVYADDVNILGGSVHTVKENAEALVVASKEIGLEVNVDKTKYMVMYRDQKAGLIHKTETDNSYCKSEDQFKLKKKNFTNQNFIQGKINSRLSLGNSWCQI